jgi:GTP-binding protein Era
MNNNQKKCAFIALMGAPNVGKSTLVNQLVGAKVTIVSPKVQTTRASVKGICMVENTQLVFVDTPGVFSPKETLEKAIVQEAWRRVNEADFIALLVDCKKGICKDTANIITSLQKQERRIVLILNKIDLVRHEELLVLSKDLNDSGVFTDTFMVSALKGNGVEKLREYYSNLAPVGEWMFPEDQIMEAPVKFFAAEITREKIFMRLQQELPYSIAVETEKWEEKSSKEVTVSQVIYVRKEGQKGIVLGRGGEMIKQIGESSRKELEKLLDCKVNLKLFVKVRENWTSNPSVYSEIGLQMPE